MRHIEFAGLEDDYFFELAQGEVTLSVGHQPSPMGGNQVRLSLDPRPGQMPSMLHPSGVGVAGFDGFWEPGLSQAYGVPNDAVSRLIQALQGREAPDTEQAK